MFQRKADDVQFANQSRDQPRDGKSRDILGAFIHLINVGEAFRRQEPIDHAMVNCL